MITPYTVIDNSHAMYPSALSQLTGGRKLYAIGPTELLKGKAIGICGSRGASERSLRWAFEFGVEAARQGLIVVSGYARGVDREAHRGAVEAGGATIAVLPHGIRNFSLVRELRAVADTDRNFLALSMFEPEAIWKAWRAMERNKLIVGISEALFVVEARERGGTINAAYESIRQGKKLYAVAYETPSVEDAGNRILLADAAIPLRSTSDLRTALESAKALPCEAGQLALNITNSNRI